MIDDLLQKEGQLRLTMLTRLLSLSSVNDIKQAVIHAVMIGDKEKILEGLKEGIKQVESV